MSEWLTQEELDRISDFANSSVYERSPEMLEPGEERDEE